MTDPKQKAIELVEKFRDSKIKLDELDRQIKDYVSAEELAEKIDSITPYIAIIFMFIMFLISLL
jgi:hypothetical protein